MRNPTPKPEVIAVLAVGADIALSLLVKEYRSGELSSIAIASYFAFISHESN